MNSSRVEQIQDFWKKNLLKKLWSTHEAKPVYYTDLIFRCPDGTIEAHKVWLSHCCSVLNKAVMNIHTCQEQFITVVVPDFSIRVVRKFLKLFYTGSVELSSYIELEEIKEFGCKELGLAMGFDQVSIL
jgi:BTB/POZ domain